MGKCSKINGIASKICGTIKSKHFKEYLWENTFEITFVVKRNTLGQWNWTCMYLILIKYFDKKIVWYFTVITILKTRANINISQQRYGVETWHDPLLYKEAFWKYFCINKWTPFLDGFTTTTSSKSTSSNSL